MENGVYNNCGDNCESPRRPVRRKTKPQRYENFLEVSPTKRRAEKALSSNSEEDEILEDTYTLKPSALFSSDDVEGQDMFKFKSRHTKLDLQNKVKSAISNSPKLLDSPSRTSRKSIGKGLNASPFGKACEGTPKHVKDIMKKRIIKEVESDSEDSDFSGSSSDEFLPDHSEDESESQSSANEEEEEDNKEERKKCMNKLTATKNKLKGKDSEYVVAPDDYFMMNSSKKITTSDHTLARLKNMNLNDNTEYESIEMCTEHKNKIQDLHKSYEHLFDKWLYALSENFNIILYGIGSKKSILQQFQMQKLSEFPCVVVNGFFPSLTMKSILETIVIDLLENSHVPSNIGDVVNLIDTQLKDCSMDLFLIVHNIDGTMLCNGKSQAMLASISQIKNLHLIATIDHINAPLLWDHSKLSKFNFTWWDTTSFLPYAEETSFENSLMTQRSGALQLSSLRSVFQSLTSNAKGIFGIIVNYQLENHKQSHYQGLPFKDLYSKSREQFLVSSDLALRAQLTEFLDHKLVKMKRTHDGSENLIIPIENTLLQLFLDQQDS